MEILINEMSLHGQFETVPSFINKSLPEFVNIFSFLNEIENYPLKNYNFYNCSITQRDTFRSLLTDKNINRISDYIRKYKTILDKIQAEPYWESDKKHDSSAFYMWNEELVTDTSLAESFEREASLLSFIPSIFEITDLEVIKEETSNRKILNFYSLKGIVDYLYEEKTISFYHFCKNYYKNSKLSFKYVNQNKSFDLINNINDETEFLNSFNLFCEMAWPDILSQGGKGANQAGLAYSRYHDQEAFKGYNFNSTIDKFRCSQKYRVFGFREKECFYVLEFDLSHRLSD